MKNILILEKQKNYRKKISDTLKLLEEKVNIIENDTVEKAYVEAMKVDIDLFLVDIKLSSQFSGDVSGLRFIENIREIEKYKYVPVIFITALEDPMLYAYKELHCFSYIEKPFEEKQLLGVVQEALQVPIPKFRRKNIYFRSHGIIYAVNTDEIIYIENLKRKLLIHTQKKNVFINYESAKQFMNKIHDHRFLQCSRYTIINTDYIESVDFTNRYITLKGIQQPLEIGISIKQEFKEKLYHLEHNLYL